MSIEAAFELEYPAFSLKVDLNLPGKGITALFGPSGCGKTTLLRCMAGLTRAPQGRLLVNGEVWQDDSHFLLTHQRPLGYVFQEASLFDHLTVRRNLEYGRSRVMGGARQHTINHTIDLLGINGLLDRMPAGLSGGERQRVAIARALLTHPHLLLMDEPLSALDAARRNEFLPYLERLHAELDIPVIYVSHSADEVARLADHLVVMEEGGVVVAGPLEETLARVDLPVHLGEETGVVVDARVTEIEPEWHLARVRFSGGELWVRDAGFLPQRKVRLRILARDVSVALSASTGTSILNILPATVAEIVDDDHPAVSLVKLNTQGSALVARVTKRSVAQLGLTVGLQVWAQIKAVAVID
jgi:molybdate transport system ATP-binding protein